LLERDRDPMVAKALSWALRELAKRDPHAVREYIARRQNVLPALVLREVKNKLSTGPKNPKRK
jgi:3-methyladenine DNA glycosylase AlkD